MLLLTTKTTVLKTHRWEEDPQKPTKQHPNTIRVSQKRNVFSRNPSSTTRNDSVNTIIQPTWLAPLTHNNKGDKKGTPQPKKKAAPSKRKAKEQSDSEEKSSDPEVEVMETDDKAKIQELKKKLALAQERVKRTESRGSRGGRGQKGRSVSSALEKLV